MSSIEYYLKSCRELTRFCAQNGWIDNDSLRYSIVMQANNEIFVDIEFDELLLESPGNLACRIPCRGQVCLYLDRFGRIIRAEAL